MPTHGNGVAQSQSRRPGASGHQGLQRVQRVGLVQGFALPQTQRAREDAMQDYPIDTR